MIILSMGTMISQLFLVLITPIVTRIYKPEELGAFTLIITIVTIFSSVINGRYDISIVSANNENEADAIAVVGILNSIVISFIICCGLSIYNIFYPETFSSIGGWVYITILMLLIIGFTNILTSFNNRYKQYKLMASVNIIRSNSQAITQIVFGLLNFGVLGLIFSQLLSLILAIKKQLNHIKSDINRFKTIKFSIVLDAFIKYKNQLIYSTPALLINSLSYSILIFFISALYGVKEVGYYSISFRMLGMPLSLVSANVAKVFFEKASVEKKETGNFYNTFKKTSLLLLVISLPFFGLLMIISEPLFELVFGFGWGRAGLFVAILSPMFAIRFIVSPLSLSLVIAKKQRVELLLQVGFLIEALCAFFISKVMGLELEYFLLIISGLFMVNYFLMYLVMLKASKENSLFS